MKKILNDLSSYLQHAVDENYPGEEVSAEVLRGLRSKPVTAVEPFRPENPGAPDPAPAATGNPPQDASRNILGQIAAEIAACKQCDLYKTRTKVVPGQGKATPEIMFIGEAPGADEDLQGLAFVGAAGQLLTKMIAAMGFKREEVFIGNILKCRPPGNRTPEPEEIEKCLPYLKRQIEILKPKVIIALGATSVRGLLGIETGITKLRGKWLCYEGVDLMPTFHPSYLLRSPSAKKDVWEDLKAVLARIGRTPPPMRPAGGGRD